MAYQERRYSLEDVTEYGGGASLTNVNTATFVTGKVGNAAQFVAASSQRLDSTDTVYHNVTTENITMWGWFYLDSTGVNHGICGQGTSSYHCHVITTNKLRFRVNRTTGGNLSLDYSGTLSASTWYFFVVEFDYDNGRLTLEINNTGRQETTFTQTGLVANTGNWSIGSIGSGNYCNGKVDEIGFRRGGLLTAWEKKAYYNGGAGRSFADVEALKAAGPYVYQEYVRWNTANVTSISLPVANQLEDHLAVAFIHLDGAPTGVAVADWESAWTSVDSDQHTTATYAQIWKRVLSAADEAETAIDFSWTGVQAVEVLVQFWANASDIDAFDLSNSGSSSSSQTAQSITTTVDDCVVMFGMFPDGNAPVISTADAIPFWTAIYSGTGGGWTWLGAEAPAAAGATGSRGFTLSGATNAIRFSLAISPAAAGTVTADLALTDGADQIDAAASPFVDAALTLTDGADELAITASPFVNVTLSLTDGADQIAAEVTVVDNTITVSLALVDGADLIEALGGPVVNAALTLVDGADIIAAAGGALVTASVTLTDGADVIAAILSDPNNTIRDIELSARPLVGITLTATPLMQITLTARPHVE